MINKYQLASEYATRLYEAVETADKVLTIGEWWDERENCGCLVGTYEHAHGSPSGYGEGSCDEDGFPDDGDNFAYYQAGIGYMTILREVLLGEQYYDSYAEVEVALTVVED
jgi:hypothetical protein